MAKLLSVGQAAALIHNAATGGVGISRQRLDRMIAAGQIAAVVDPHGYRLIDSREIVRINKTQRTMGRPPVN